MRVKSWHVPLGLCLAVIAAGVLFAVPASPAAEAEADDSDAEDCLSKGRACFERGEYDEALKWYERGLALKPEDPKFYVGKASALYKLGGFVEAVDNIDRALELGPDDWVMQFMKGAKLWIHEQPEEAVESFDRAVELYDGGYPSILLDYDIGEGKLKISISLVHFVKANVLCELGRFEEALACYDDAIKLYDREDRFPIYDLYEAYEEKINALKGMGRLEDALEVYDEALELYPQDESLRRGKGEVLLELGRYEEAAQYNELSAVTLGLSGPTKKVGTTPMKEGQVEVSTPGITGTAIANSLRSSAVIANIVNQLKSGIEYIYKKYLKTDPNLEGKLVVKFTVAASGGVTACSVVSSTLGNAALEQEVCDRVLTWRFPLIDEGHVVVVYPFVFYSAGAK